MIASVSPLIVSRRGSPSSTYPPTPRTTTMMASAFPSLPPLPVLRLPASRFLRRSSLPSTVTTTRAMTREEKTAALTMTFGWPSPPPSRSAVAGSSRAWVSPETRTSPPPCGSSAAAAGRPSTSLPPTAHTPRSRYRRPRIRWRMRRPPPPTSPRASRWSPDAYTTRTWRRSERLSTPSPPSLRDHGARASSGNAGIREANDGGAIVLASDDACRIKNLDTGEELVVSEFGKDWKINDLHTGLHIMMEEFARFLGFSPVVKELMHQVTLGGGSGGDHRSNDRAIKISVSKKLEL